MESPDLSIKTQTLNPGELVQFKCPIDSDPSQIYFGLNGIPIIENSNDTLKGVRVINDDYSKWIRIRRVTKKLEGVWSCWVAGEGEETPKSLINITRLFVKEAPTLPVLVLPQPEGDDPEELFISLSDNVTITLNENDILDIKCYLRDCPAPPPEYIHWFLGNSIGSPIAGMENVTQLSEIYLSQHYPNSPYQVYSKIRLNITKSMHLNSLTCVAKHPLWLTPMTTSALIDVHYEPSFTISREPAFEVPVSEGMRVNLTCLVDSNPPVNSSSSSKSKPTWYKDALPSAASEEASKSNIEPADGSRLSLPLESQTDGSLILDPVQKSHAGWYRCRVDTDQGNFSSVGYYLPVNSKSTTQVVKSPISKLMAPNQLPLGGRERNLQDTTLHTAVSRIHHSPQVAFDGPPEIELPPESTVIAQIGKPLVLNLKFCSKSYPDRLFWIHRHLALVPGRIYCHYITRELQPIYNSFYCYQSTFEIEPVKAEDIGTINVFISNSKGHSNAQISIKLSNTSDSSSSFSVSDRSSRVSNASSCNPGLTFSLLLSLSLIIQALQVLAKSNILCKLN